MDLYDTYTLMMEEAKQSPEEIRFKQYTQTTINSLQAAYLKLSSYAGFLASENVSPELKDYTENLSLKLKDILDNFTQQFQSFK